MAERTEVFWAQRFCFKLSQRIARESHGIRLSPKVTIFPSGTFQTLNLQKSPWDDLPGTKHWPTFDCRHGHTERPLLLTVPCEYDDCDARRHAGPSAAAETCLFN